MNDDPVFNRLRESRWRRPLTQAEQAEWRAWLATHPEAQADEEAEAGLSELLARLPVTPVPSNFTARLLQAIEQDEAQRARTRSEDWRWFWHALAPRAAVAAVLATACSFAYGRHVEARRAELAESVAAVTDAHLVSNPVYFTNFNVIRRLSPAPPPDTALLALLK